MTLARLTILLPLLIGVALISAILPAAGQIAGTKHNLSVFGPGPVKAATEEEICIFCHTPHRARPDVAYLWNRADSTASYTTYESSTLHATVGQPTGASKLCLSCHDGTIALGAVLSRPTEIPFADGIRFQPEGPARLGTDLSDDHPVSFVYDQALASARGELVSPAELTGAIRLDQAGEVQCTACHNAHDNRLGNFLLDANRFSSLCLTCHRPRDWDLGTHATSIATWDGAAPDPWPHTDFANVAENGCENCHSPHTAGGHAGLLNYAVEEDNCLACHNGNVAATDISAELTKLSAHRVQDFAGIHDPAEDFAAMVTEHVECADCHNPHRVNNAAATAPDVSGRSTGVKGVDSSGTQVAEATFAYEICFKCHADRNVIDFAEISRQAPELNTRLEFDTTNPSYHPVGAPGQNPDVPSLLAPFTENSVIYCTDCHNSDDGPSAGGTGAGGPHGSNNRFLLERNYTTADFTHESPFEYALCYKCHDRSSILADESFAEHNRHLGGVRAPCSACHDPHGISATQGDAIENSHLINFDVNIVLPIGPDEPPPRFEDRGTFTGACYLKCHNKKHEPDNPVPTGVYP